MAYFGRGGDSFTRMLVACYCKNTVHNRAALLNFIVATTQSSADSFGGVGLS